MDLTFGELTDTPLGPISFYAGDRGLRGLYFSPLKSIKKQENLREGRPSLFGLETVGLLFSELNEYMFGIRRTFSTKIDWDVVTGFQQKVLEVTLEIPYGQVRTYGEVAETLRKPGAARAVGIALGRNPLPIVIPCHRVIGADGSLRGYTNGIDSKAFLLGLEGQNISGGNRITLSTNEDEDKS